MTDNKGHRLYFAFMTCWMLELGLDKTLTAICGRPNGGLDASVFWFLGGVMAVIYVILLGARSKAPPVNPVKPVQGLMLISCIILGLFIIFNTPFEVMNAASPLVSLPLKFAFGIIFFANATVWLLWTWETYQSWRAGRDRSILASNPSGRDTLPSG